MIRRAGLDDLDGLLTLVAAFYRVDGHAFVENRVRAALRPLLTDDAVGQVWVLQRRGTLGGYAVVTWSYSLESGGRDCILDELFVVDRGRGHGTALLRAALESASESGARAVFLETEAANARVRRFYQRRGFTVENSVWMRRPLL